MRTPIKATAREPSNRPDTNQRLPTAPSLAKGSRSIQKGHEQKPLLLRPSGWFQFDERTFTRGSADVAIAPLAAVRGAAPK